MASEPPRKLREIVREHRFESDVAAILVDAEAADDALAALEWRLARHPEEGSPLHRLRDLDHEVRAGTRAPTLTVFYTFDEERVYLKSARLARPNEY
ncbi:MAG TPA: hypothetical protein VF746_18215 [Longimicrobium sp.]|jgi:hypothetical protein